MWVKVVFEIQYKIYILKTTNSVSDKMYIIAFY